MSKDTSFNAYAIVSRYRASESDFKRRKQEFEKAKQTFYSDMKKWFAKYGNPAQLAVHPKSDKVCSPENQLVITKVDKSKVVFDADKVEMVIGKRKSKLVIRKRYEINDINGLISYLKSCNVDPVKFKSFLSIEKTVDGKALDNLEQIGEINVDDLKGCYTVKHSEPYFMVKKK